MIQNTPLVTVDVKEEHEGDVINRWMYAAARIQLRYELNTNETCNRVLLDSEIKEGKIWISEITTVYKTRVVVVSHRILEDISPQDVGMSTETILSDALKVIRDYAFAEPHENVENPCRGVRMPRIQNVIAPVGFAPGSLAPKSLIFYCIHSQDDVQSCENPYFCISSLCGKGGKETC